MPIMNLWAEFENEQPLAESAGRVQKQRSLQGGRLTEQAVLSSLRDWLLHDYVASYCRSLAATRIYRRCYWIDGLGGNRPVVGLSQELAQGNKPITLHGIVLEAGSSKRNEVKIVEDANGVKAPVFVLPKESGTVRASWLEVESTLLTFIDQSPAIFLLNPFGHTLFTYDDLAPLYTRTAPTELCLLISHKQVEMRVIPSLRASSEGFGGRADPSSPTGDHKGSPLRTGGQVDVNRTTGGALHAVISLTALLRSDCWKGLVSKGEGVEQIVDGIIDLLIASMQRHFLAVQRIVLPVVMGPAMVEEAPYTLIFATRRQDSLTCMNDAVCLYRRRLYEQSLRGVLIEDWFARQQQERLKARMEQLYARTLQQGRSTRVRRWPDLRQQLLLAHFGQFTLHDYDEIIRKLLLSGEVRCEWRQRSRPGSGNHDQALGRAQGTAPTEDRVPGNEDTLIWK